MTMFGPITTVIAALPMVFVPHAARTRHSVDARSQWRQLVKISAVTAGTTLLATVCLTHVPGALGTALLGQSWEETLWLVPFIGTQWAAMAWLTSVNTFFQSQGASAAVVRLNLSHMALQISLCVLAGLVFRTAVAIGVALAVSGWLIAVIGTGSVQVWLRRRDQACALGSGLVAGAADGVLAR
jgi:O-antigen/teichoic acid export membrane protein